MSKATGGRRRKKGGDEAAMESGGMMRWLLTYADLITLLLIMFIVLYSMSQISAAKFSAAMQSIVSAFGAGTNVLSVGSEGRDIVVIGMPRKEIERKLAEVEERHPEIRGQVLLREDERGLIITVLTDKVIFDVGRAELRTQAKEVLDGIAEVLRRMDNQILIEGHTDNQPFRGGAYASNWELSTARATSVVRYFGERNGIEPTRLAAAGYAEYRPLVPNDTEEHRMANRRIDIVILDRPDHGSRPGLTRPLADEKPMVAVTPGIFTQETTAGKIWKAEADLKRKAQPKKPR